VAEVVAPAAGPVAARIERDTAAWDAFVASTALAPYLQASPWAEVKARNGWRAHRLLVGGGERALGCQLLVHPVGPLPWSVGYAPRGPVGKGLDEALVTAWSSALRRLAGRLRLSHVVVDPEIQAGGPELGWFRRAGWRPCSSPQPARSRWIDLERPEETLWGDLRPKWRQYVQKARRNGIEVVEAGPGRMDEFYAIYVDTARRAGFPYRTESTYRAVEAAFSAHGRARLLIAQDGSGTAQATLLLVGWGRRMIEPYGGMTRAGAESRANYLLKWEAIRRARAEGYAIYDLWGLSHPGIAHFKAGFGGREVTFIGGLQLDLWPLVRRAVDAVQTMRVAAVRRGLTGGRTAGPDGDAA
jgi:lipid II:glycine glycyltransferase (peptidoglycan interpeptide bridge formation enzyme)